MSRLAHFRDIDAFFLDLDGCVYFGDRIAEGAVAFLKRVRGAGKALYFLTNNSTHSSESVAERLRDMGITVEAEHVLTATDYVGTYILERWGRVRLKAVGSAGLENALAAAGHRVLPLDAKQNADIVVIGRDTDFTYRKLAAAAEEVRRGARLIAANPDLYHPGPSGEHVPETGAMAAAIEAVAGVRAEYVGKPAPHMFRYGLGLCGVEPSRSVMIGDNLQTDIRGGVAAGMRTVWLYGEQSKDNASADGDTLVPDLAVKHLAELLQML